MKAIILASGSPRRSEILTRMGVAFEKQAANVDEHCDLGAWEAVAELSRRKALAVAAHFPGRVVLAADTLVALENRPLGKPEDEEDACRMLERLSGREHQVYTGVCVVDAQGRVMQAVDASDVCFRAITKDEIRAYVATGGSRSNVIGLPWDTTQRLLQAAGVPVDAGNEQDGMVAWR